MSDELAQPKPYAIRNTQYVSRFTHHAARFTHRTGPPYASVTNFVTCPRVAALPGRK